MARQITNLLHFFYENSKSQFLRLARHISRKEACDLTFFLCKRYQLTVPKSCIAEDMSRSIVEHLQLLFACSNVIYFRRINHMNMMRAFAMGVKVSPKSYLFVSIFRSSKIFSIINYLHEMTVFFLRALFFKSSLISN